MIANFDDADAKRIFEGKRSKRLPPSVHRVALRKLVMLDAALLLADLRVPPGNRLKKLSGVYAGYHSIRINDQWRICFRWERGGVWNVHITDYH